MRSVIGALWMVVVLLAGEAFAEPASPKSRDFATERHTLDNGLTVLFVPTGSGGLVSYWTIVRTGSRDEVEPGVTGFAHFFEHMMFRGSKRFPGAAYDKIVTSLGADANAYTTDDYTAYHMSFSKTDLPTVIDLEADRFQYLDYDEVAFKTEAGAVYGEFRKGRTDPWEVLYEALLDKAFDVHTYKHTTIGFESDIAKMPEQFAYSKSFFTRFYRPENCVVLVVGDFDPKSTLQLIEKHYGTWKAGYVKPNVPVEPTQNGARRVDVTFPGETRPLLAVMWKGERFMPDDQTMVAAKLVGELAFGETSPLYKKLVLEEQRVETLTGSVEYQRDPGLWGALAVVKDPADIGRIEREIRDAVALIARDGVAPSRLDAIRSRMKYGFLSRLQSAGDIAGLVARFVALTGGLEAIDDLFRTLDFVSVEDVRKAASTWFVDSRLTVARLRAESATLAPPPEPSVATTTTLSEKVVLRPVANDPNTSVLAWVKVGSMNDPVGKEGLALLTATLLAEGGTEKSPYEKILEILFPMAAGYSASVDKEMTVFSGLSHRDFGTRFGDLFADAIAHPRFDPEDFERVRASMVSYLENTLRFSSDEELGKAALYQTIFRGTRYAHPPEGTVMSLKSMTLEDVKAFWKTHYTRDNIVLGVAGEYDNSVPDQISRALGVLDGGKPPKTTAPTVGARKSREVLIVEKPGPSTAISFGHPIAVKRGSREYYALWIASSWLGEHRNSVSHLYQVIREARGMNYGDYAYIEAYPNGGRLSLPPTGVGRNAQIFEVWIRPVQEHQAVFATRAALREVETLVKNGLTKEQFETTRQFLTRYILHYADTTEKRLGYAIDDMFYGLKDHLGTAPKMFASITLDEVNAAIRKHIRPRELVFAFVTEHAQALREKLTSGEASPITYPEGVTKSAEHLEEDRLIEKYPLGIGAENISIVPVTTMFER